MIPFDSRVTLKDTAAAIAERILELSAVQPTIGVVLGSGFANAVDGFNVETTLNLHDFEHYPRLSVDGHKAALSIVRFVNTLVVLFHGRPHRYEGRSSQETTVAIEIMRLAGIKKCVVTNAVGGLSPQLTTGDIVQVADVIERIPGVPFTAPVRQVSMLNNEWARRFVTACSEVNIHVKPATYVSVLGPSYETRAEIRMLRTMGADVVGMSLTPELKGAAARDIQCLALSLVTNVATDTHSKPISHTEVVTAARSAATNLHAVLKTAIFTA